MLRNTLVFFVILSIISYPIFSNESFVGAKIVHLLVSSFNASTKSVSFTNEHKIDNSSVSQIMSTYKSKKTNKRGKA